jgi:hypothetical protein
MISSPRLRDCTTRDAVQPANATAATIAPTGVALGMQ